MLIQIYSGFCFRKLAGQETEPRDGESVPAKEGDLLIPNGKNILYGDLNFPLTVNNEISGLGKIMFDDALIYFKRNQTIDGVYGYWIKDPILYAEYGGESINLFKFKNALAKNMTRELAAFETITGKWARESGFDKVQFISPSSDNNIVKVIFTK